MSHVPDAIRRAQLRLEKAKAEVSRWEDFLKTWQELESDRSDMLVADIPGELKMTITRAISRHAFPSRVTARTDETDALAAAIVAERGPMSTRLLITALADRGHVVTGKDPYGTLHTRLTRGSRLVFDKVVGWKSNTEVPAASALPEPETSRLNHSPNEEGGESSMAARDSPQN